MRGSAVASCISCSTPFTYGPPRLLIVQPRPFKRASSGALQRTMTAGAARRRGGGARPRPACGGGRRRRACAGRRTPRSASRLLRSARSESETKEPAFEDAARRGAAAGTPAPHRAGAWWRGARLCRNQGESLACGSGPGAPRRPRPRPRPRPYRRPCPCRRPCRRQSRRAVQPPRRTRAAAAARRARAQLQAARTRAAAPRRRRRGARVLEGVQGASTHHRLGVGVVWQAERAGQRLDCAAELLCRGRGGRGRRRGRGGRGGLVHSCDAWQLVGVLERHGVG